MEPDPFCEIIICDLAKLLETALDIEIVGLCVAPINMMEQSLQTIHYTKKLAPLRFV